MSMASLRNRVYELWLVLQNMCMHFKATTVEKQGHSADLYNIPDAYTHKYPHSDYIHIRLVR